MRKLLRFIGWASLLFMLLVAALVTSGYLYLRSANGRDRLMAYGLHELRPLFPGGMKVGRIEGDPIRGLILHDVELDDLEGQPAVMAERLEVRYLILPLWSRTVAVSLVDGRGVLVVSRTLKAGRDNLATMVKVAPSNEPLLHLPVAIDLERLVLSGRFVRLPRNTPLSRAPKDSDVRLHAHGSASISRALILRVGDVRIELETPVRGRLAASGIVELGPEMAARNVVLDVDADSKALCSRVEQIILRGPMALHAKLDGAFDDLRGNLWVEVPEDRLSLLARAQLRSDRVAVEALHLTTPFARVDASGVAHFNGRVEAKARATVSRLDALAAFGGPLLRGRASVEGEIRKEAQSLRLKLKGRGDELVFGDAKISSIGIDVDAVDLVGHAVIEARGLRSGDLALTTARLEARGTATALRIAADAGGPEHTSAHVLIAGKPRIRDGQLIAVDAELERLRLTVGRNEWREQHAARLSVDLERARYELSRLDIAGPGEAQLRLEAKLHEAQIESSLIEVKRFDLSKLAALLSPGHVLPHTDLYVVAHARGAFDDPEVHARISGEANGRSEKDLIRVSGQAETHLVRKRLTGDVFVTIGGQKVSAKLDVPMPLRPHAPIDVAVDASVLLSPTFSELLVPKLIQFQPQAMFTLSGTVTANLRITGTTSTPEIHGGARLANWEAEGARGAVGLSVDYQARSLGASLTADFSSLPGGGGKGGGQITATTRVAMDLGALLSGEGGVVLPDDALINGTAALNRVAIDHLPLRAFNIIPPLQHGIIDGELALSGTIRHPRLSAKLAAARFDAVRLGLNGLGATLSATLEGSAVTGDATLSVRGAQALHVHGSIDGGRRTDPARADFRRAPVIVQADVEGFELEHLGLIAGLKGKLGGFAKLSGSLAQLDAQANFDIDGLQLGETRFTRFQLRGELGQTAAGARISAEQAGGGRFELDSKLPWRGGAFEARLLASHFLFDVRADKLPGIRVLRGTLDADLRLSGTAAAPVLHGKLQIEDGTLAVPTTAMTYREIRAALQIDEHALIVERLAVRAGNDGTAELKGKLALEGLRPQSLEATLTTRRFPFLQQGIAMLLDGELEASGKRNADGALSGRLRIKRGSAQLPELQRTRFLHPTGGLSDVRVVDKATPRGAGDAVTTKLRIGARVDGPFVIKGKEVGAQARGELTVDLGGDRPVLRGALRVEPGGWIDLFGRRYDLERGQVTFDGSEQPLLDFRLARRTPSATIGVDVSGRATAPKLEFWSSPPIYDRTQVAGLVLSGDPGSTRVSTTALSRQAMGAISSLVVNSLRQNFLPELPIDVFRVDANRSTGAGVQGSQVEVGKYLTESVYLGYAYQLGVDRVGSRRANRNEARLDYRLSRNWQVETSSGDAGVGGLDLYWTYRP